MTKIEGIEVGAKLIEGKTKVVYDLPSEPGHCFILSKDRITAGDGVKSHEMEGKAEISTATLTKIFDFLTEAGIKNHFVRKHSEKSFIALKCDMIPIEFVTRRVATGSFLKRNEGVPEGSKFSPPKLEYFYKDDANHDPQWSYEQIAAAQIKCGSKVISHDDIDILTRTTQTVFEVLERAWQSLDCQLIDMKIEFGVDQSGNLMLSDVIDSDSWRLWPQGDKRLMLDKQVYRNMDQVTQEGLDTVKRNFRYVADRLDKFNPKSRGRVVILMGSATDKPFCKKIQDQCLRYGVSAVMRVTSAHKAPSETLNILAEYEGSSDPHVVIAVAGRSNGLGPVSSGNTCLPVINCPPINADWGREDIWSSLRLPSGLGCATVTSPEAAAQMAAHIFALTDHVIWAKMRAQQLNFYVGLKLADVSTRKE
jgi:phosphoribosylaminoimidazole carboxylase/phosphoribosylaminoimidazole-succinocarboxamide synthase